MNLDKNPVTIDWKSIANKRENLTPVISDTKEVPENGEVKFDNLAIGAYYVYAASKKTTYNPMGEAVYGYDDNGLMIAQDKTIDAKGSTYTLTKAFTGDDGQTTYQVVNRGQEVPFTITATFPSYDKDAKDRAFQITDEPKGMKVKEVTVKVGEAPLAAGTDYKLVSVKDDGTDGDEITTLPAAEDQKVRVRFTSAYIGTDNRHAGQTVTVEVKAQITDADTFVNKASSDKGSKPSEVNGKLGSITINKYDENNSKLLADAEFSIAPMKEDEVGAKNSVCTCWDKTKTDSLFIKKQLKKKIKNDDITKVTNIVAKNGVVVAKGLDDGKYKIVEEKSSSWIFCSDCKRCNN